MDAVVEEELVLNLDVDTVDRVQLSTAVVGVITHHELSPQQRRSVDASESDALHLALCESCLHRDTAALRQLLADGRCDPNSCSTGIGDIAGPFDGDTPLTLAARIGDVEAVAALLAAGADVARVGPRLLTALHEAAMFGRLAVIQLLMAHGAPTDGPGALNARWPSPRGTAASEASAAAATTREATWSVEAEASIVCSIAREGSLLFFEEGLGGYEEIRQYTPLHAAAEWGHEPVLVLLLEAGACLSHEDDFGQTPEVLAIAAQKQRKAQGYTKAAGERGRCAELLRRYRVAEQAQRRSMVSTAGDGEAGDVRSETDSRLRGYAEAAKNCPQSVRWRRALKVEIARAGDEMAEMLGRANAHGRLCVEEDQEMRVAHRAAVARGNDEQRQRIEAGTQARVSEAEQVAGRAESKRKLALRDVVKDFTLKQKEATEAKLKLQDGKTSMNPGWAKMRDSIVKRLEADAEGANLAAVVAAAALTNVRTRQLKQALRDKVEMRRTVRSAQSEAEVKEEECGTVRRLVEEGEAAATTRAAALAAALEATRSEVKQRLVSYEQCAEALHEAFLCLRNTADGGGTVSACGEDVASGLKEVEDLRERCLALRAALRKDRVVATLTCGSAHSHLAVADCADEVRRLRLGQAVAGAMSAITAASGRDAAAMWKRKTSARQQHDGTAGGIQEEVGAAQEWVRQEWVHLLGQSIGAHLSVTIVPSLATGMLEQKRSKAVLAEQRAAAVEARRAACCAEALSLGRRARSALGSSDAAAQGGTVLKEAIAEVRLHSARRRADEEQAIQLSQVTGGGAGLLSFETWAQEDENTLLAEAALGGALGGGGGKTEQHRQ